MTEHTLNDVRVEVRVGYARLGLRLRYWVRYWVRVTNIVRLVM